MAKINLTPLSQDKPILIEDSDYQELVNKKNNGWSHCEHELEWLSKLHYLRTGFREKKIDASVFAKSEANLVLNWWKRWL